MVAKRRLHPGIACMIPAVLNLYHVRWSIAEAWHVNVTLTATCSFLQMICILVDRVHCFHTLNPQPTLPYVLLSHHPHSPRVTTNLFNRNGIETILELALALCQQSVSKCYILMECVYAQCTIYFDVLAGTPIGVERHQLIMAVSA